MGETTDYVVCIDNTDYGSSLEIRKIYQLVPDGDAERRDMLRVVDESGEDYLYPSSRFLRIELPKEVVAALNRAA